MKERRFHLGLVGAVALVGSFCVSVFLSGCFTCSCPPPEVKELPSSSIGVAVLEWTSGLHAPVGSAQLDNPDPSDCWCPYSCNRPGMGGAVESGGAEGVSGAASDEETLPNDLSESSAGREALQAGEIGIYSDKVVLNYQTDQGRYRVTWTIDGT